MVGVIAHHVADIKVPFVDDMMVLAITCMVVVLMFTCWDFYVCVRCLCRQKMRRVSTKRHRGGFRRLGNRDCDDRVDVPRGAKRTYLCAVCEIGLDL